MGKKEKQAKEKPLEKMTSKELREMALEIPAITGAHGMNKTELISAIKQAKGIAEDDSKGASADVRGIKAQIKALKEKRAAALAEMDAVMATRYRRAISKLKKKTRRAA